MPYEQRWSSGNPGCLIVLLDQSGSMNDVIVGDKLGRRKCDLAAEIVNQTLSRMVDFNTTMEGVKDRAEVAVIGYGGSGVASALGGFLAAQDIASLSELAANVVRTEQQEVHGVDNRGEPIVTIVDHLIWVEPSADGGTPMGEAYRKAYSLADAWVRAHPTSHPPVVINISDGGATDCGPSRDFTSYARQLVEVATDDGNALLLNIHITEKQSTPIEYPAQLPNLSGVAGDEVTEMLAKYLFDTASVLPDQVLGRMQAVGYNVESGARGFVFNGDGPTLTRMFVFATPPSDATPGEFRMDL